MYCWNTKKLAIEIKENTINENAKKNYYFAGSVLLIISFFLLRVSPEKMTSIQYGILFTELLITALVYYIGIKITYASNKGIIGVGYIEKIVMLSFPLNVKLFVLGMLIGVGVGILYVTTGSLLIKTVCSSIFSILIQICYFWRLNVFMKFINN